MGIGDVETIYVYLLDEGVDVWRPVLAKKLGPDTHEIIGAPPGDDPATEQWQFPPGTRVKVAVKRLQEGAQPARDVLVAVEAVFA
jgi:hypothetical protein